MASPRFHPGSKVKVLDLRKTGHVRIPVYIRTQSGVVIQYCGCYLNPEDLAIGNTAGPAIDLYRVRFDQRILWPENNHIAGDTLTIEIYDHWLEPLPTTMSIETDKPRQTNNER